MARFILHIGSHKTGTSALQSAFSMNEEQLMSRGVYYPPSNTHREAKRGRITSGNAVVMSRFLNPPAARPGNPAQLMRLVDGALQQAEGRDVLYSSEFLCRFQESRLAQLRDHLSGHGYTLHCVYYVRSIGGHAFSEYSQKVKRHLCTKSFAEYVRTTYENDFVDVVERLLRTLPAESISIRNYDRVKKDIFAGFVSRELGLTYDAAQFVQPPASVNRSLNYYEIELMRIFNTSFSLPSQSAFVSDALIYGTKPQGTKVFLTPEEIQHIENRYAADISMLNEHLRGEPLSVIDDGIQVGERPSIDLGPLESSLIGVMAHLVSHMIQRQVKAPPTMHE